MLTYQKGVALAEYGLIGALVLVVCIGGVTAIGTAIRNEMTNIQTPFSGQAVAAVPPAVGSAGAGNADNPGGTGTDGGLLDPNGSNDLAGLDTSSNGSINLSGYPFDLQSSVETTGSNGTTHMLASKIEELVDAMLASGEITPEQASSLIALANQGHKLGNIQALLENQAAKSTSSDEFSYSTLTFEGKQYTPAELALLIGWGAAPWDVTDPLSTQGAGSELANFLNMYHQIETSGVLKNPAAQAIVKDLSSQIAIASDLVEGNSWNIMHGRIEPSGMQQQMALDTQYYPETHANAGGICTTGGGTDNGTSCSP